MAKLGVEQGDHFDGLRVYRPCDVRDLSVNATNDKITARPECKMREVVNFTLMLPISAIVLVASVCVVTMSLERILGRPIPNLQGSQPIRMNRAFTAVPVMMVVVFSWTLRGILYKDICSDCAYPYAWQRPVRLMEDSFVALAFSSAAGWIIFAGLLTVSSGLRLIWRRNSN